MAHSAFVLIIEPSPVHAEGEREDSSHVIAEEQPVFETRVEELSRSETASVKARPRREPRPPNRYGDFVSY
ncbi:hypothetical protein AAHA92_19506 [Salvia divinorum]|uniref:Uncharacterized protein n=1 Tax=Salvia divinorum TaxID=28513 RepID=A0ABD1H5K5_SALDI